LNIHTHTHTYTNIYACIYVYVYIYIYIWWLSGRFPLWGLEYRAWFPPAVLWVNLRVVRCPDTPPGSLQAGQLPTDRIWFTLYIYILRERERRTHIDRQIDQ